MSSPPLVHLTPGDVSGTLMKDGSLAFLGLPYAAPPIGSLRLCPPHPLSSWKSVLECTKAGKESVQSNQGAMGGVLPPRKAGVDPTTGLADYMSEDCLVLNVFTPSLAAPVREKQGFPVMVWIHGGAFTAGGGYNAMYKPDGFVQRGVVYVSVNYRLGILGFFHNPNDKESVANVGLLDQIEALKWVQREIAQFGGDPNNVTVFGESAGAMSIGCLLGSPLSQGLFNRAILQSGACHNVLHAAQAQESARLLAEELKLEGEVTVKCLQQLSVSELLKAQERLGNKLLSAPPLAKYLKANLVFQPVVSGPVFPSNVHPLDYIRMSKSRVQCMMGTNEEEFRLYMFASSKAKYDNESLKRWLGHTLSEDPLWEDTSAVTIVDQLAAERTPEDTYARVQSDLIFDLPMWRLADCLALSTPAYVYRFCWRSPIKKLKSCHALELPFVFGSFNENGINMFAGTGPAAAKMSSILQDVWVGFAKTGNPGWDSYVPQTRRVMIFGENNQATQRLEENSRAQEIDMWSSARLRFRNPIAKL